MNALLPLSQLIHGEKALLDLGRCLNYPSQEVIEALLELSQWAHHPYYFERKLMSVYTQLETQVVPVNIVHYIQFKRHFEQALQRMIQHLDRLKLYEFTHPEYPAFEWRELTPQWDIIVEDDETIHRNTYP